MTRTAPTRPADHAASMTAPLTIYLNDHLLGATSGSELARRIAKQHAMSPAGQTLVRIADDVAQDRAALLQIMSDLGVPARRYKICAGWALEKAGRAKTNGFLIRRSPLSSVVELEALRLGMEGKRLMWQALHALSGTGRNSGLEAEQLTSLIQRARNQAEIVEELQLQAAAGVLPRT
ncbi:MAG TPA: hypothetical protein VGO89_19060 [Streptomyces sp.]|jgi:hypothetical protein|nr:hypothetical protein [Streptomyces sp.]